MLLRSNLLHVNYDIGHTVANAVVRGAVYHTEGKLYSHLSFGESVILTIVIIAAVAFWSKRR